MANIEVTNFLVQNFVITPAALAVNDKPPNIQGQKWLLVLAGTANLELAGRHVVNTIPHDILHINPDIVRPCHFAINQHAIPRPPGDENRQWVVQFQVEQLAPFVGIAGFGDDDSDHMLCEIVRWFPSPFKTGFDAFSIPPVTITSLFDGILTDIAIVDEDTAFRVVSYHITLLGKIVFTKIVIT